VSILTPELTFNSLKDYEFQQAETLVELHSFTLSPLSSPRTLLFLLLHPFLGFRSDRQHCPQGLFPEFASAARVAVSEVGRLLLIWIVVVAMLDFLLWLRG
jgi:hypothetical protein